MSTNLSSIPLQRTLVVHRWILSLRWFVMYGTGVPFHRHLFKRFIRLILIHNSQDELIPFLTVAKDLKFSLMNVKRFRGGEGSIHQQGEGLQRNSILCLRNVWRQNVVLKKDIA